MTIRTVAPFDSPNRTKVTEKAPGTFEVENFPGHAETLPPEPPLRTEAQIVDAFVKALQTMDIAKVIVRDIRLKTEKNIAGEILTASIRGDVSLTFRGE